MKTSDLRQLGPSSPVAKIAFDQVSWDTGDGDTAKTTTRNGVNMLVERVDVIISSVTANPTVDVTFADENSVAVIEATNFATLADGTSHIMKATKAVPDFAAVTLANDVTVTVDPSADPGGSGQTLTVDVIFYGV